MRQVRLTDIDSRLPNLALMKLGHWHQAQGDKVVLTSNIYHELLEPEYDLVYGSCLFSFSDKKLAIFRRQWPQAIIGGSGSGHMLTVEDIVGGQYEHYDYSLYPDYPWSLGFTSRGCRLHCPFCSVQEREGRIHSVATVADIWRPGTPRAVLLLDNDFFGQSVWRERVDELTRGRFMVSLNQGINIRLLTDEMAQAVATLNYRDDQFASRRLYVAWDNLKDEARFMAGVDKLEQAGVPLTHLMVYMLVGYDPRETMTQVLYRFQRIVERNMLPYPMVYNNADLQLKRFQRWVVRRYYKFMPWEEYRPEEHDRDTHQELEFTL